MILKVIPVEVVHIELQIRFSLSTSKKRNPFLALSAPGLNPAVLAAVDFSNRAATPLSCRASYSG